MPLDNPPGWGIKDERASMSAAVAAWDFGANQNGGILVVFVKNLTIPGAETDPTSSGRR
jgi:hypothetical protein